MYDEFDCDYIVLDTQSGGIGVYDNLVTNLYDKEENIEYEALSCCNDADMASRCMIDDAPKVIWSMKAYEQINNDMHIYVKDDLKQGKLRLLVNEIEGKDFLKEIKGFEGLYYINEQGEILSESCNSNSNKGRRLLKQSVNKNGYNIVNLCNKTYLVHRLVAQTFIPNIYKLPQVNHKNEIKTDNRVCNLEWCDEKYNINYGTRIYRCAEKYRKPVKVINIKTGINKVCDSYSSACCYIKCTRGSIRYALLHDSIINNTYKIELL